MAARVPKRDLATSIKVLVGGGSGFIGQALCKSLRKRGYETVLLSRTPGHSKITWVTSQ
jgi:hypothetical protein